MNCIRGHVRIPSGPQKDKVKRRRLKAKVCNSLITDFFRKKAILMLVTKPLPMVTSRELKY